jgi:hypothetical protein
VENPLARGQAVVKVGGCGCWWTVGVADRVISGIPGADYGTFFRNLETGQITIQFSTEDNNRGSLILGWDPLIQKWTVAGWMHQGTPTFESLEPENLFPVLFLENSDNAVDAEVDGTVYESIPINDTQFELRPVPFFARFRIEDDPEFNQSIFKGCVVQ